MNSAELNDWTKTLAPRVALLCRHFHNYPETRTIQYQLKKAATSVAANYWAAWRARSRNEWYTKICVVSE